MSRYTSPQTPLKERYSDISIKNEPFIIPELAFRLHTMVYSLATMI